MITRRTNRPWLALSLLLAVALIGAACFGGNDNEDVDADEQFRPTNSAFPSPDRDANDDANDTVADADADDDSADDDSADDADTTDDNAGDAAQPDDTAPDTTPDAADELDLADDIVRRYISDTYKYSLELVCGPFCNATSAGVDQVGFLADAGGALINIEVRNVPDPDSPDLDALESAWQDRTADNGTFAILDRRAITLPADTVSPALLLDWEIDRRAVGGVEERWRTLITQVGPIAYFVSVGALTEIFNDVEPFLQQSLDSFLARQEPPSVPGLYSKWEFALPYSLDSVNGEIGQRTPTPSFDAGVFLLQTDLGQLQFVLTWESIGEALFDPGQAITDLLAPAGGLTTTETERGQTTLADGPPVTFALARSEDTGGAFQLTAVFAWYCTDSGRSFILQAFSLDDPRAVAQPALDGFQCTLP
jgi:hypothetical protein